MKSYCLFVFLLLLCSKETVLSTKMSSRHHFTPSVQLMQWGHVFLKATFLDLSALLLLHLSLTVAFLLSQLCPPLFSSVNMPHIQSLKDQLTCLHHIYGMHTSKNIYMLFCSCVLLFVLLSDRFLKYKSLVHSFLGFEVLYSCFNPEFKCQLFIKCILHSLWEAHFAKKPSVLLISLPLYISPSTLTISF